MQSLVKALSMLVCLVALMAGSAWAQQSKDFFITNWRTQYIDHIWLKVIASDTLNYSWEEVNGSLKGSGTCVTGVLKINNLPQHDTIRLTIESKNLLGFNTLDSGCTARWLYDVEQWGTSKFKYLDNAFNDCTNLNVNAKDIPNLSECTSLNYLFYGCESLYGPYNINNWDVSTINTMRGTFFDARFFDQPLSKWNTSNVLYMDSLFLDAGNFNQAIGNWNTAKVQSMSYMFAFTSFNQSLNNWNVSSVKNFSRMFLRAAYFNQPLNNWNTSQATNMAALFCSAYAFNQNISTWNTSKVEDMADMFEFTKNFNQPLNSWNTGNVRNFSAMFFDAEAFNQPLNSWNTSKGEDFSDMFFGTLVFNQPLDKWDMSSATNLSSMFMAASAFNGKIGTWNTTNVTDLSDMFFSAGSFNQEMNAWNTSSVTDMADMFAFARSFNKPLNNWNTGNVKYMNGVFNGASNFNQPLDLWNTKKVVSMSGMFANASKFNQDISKWDIRSLQGMYAMFYEASAFNQPIGSWPITQVRNFSSVFEGASSFNQSIGKWVIPSEAKLDKMLDYCGIDCGNYSETLKGWATSPKTGLNNQLSAINMSYGEDVEEYRSKLISEKGWVFNGDKKVNSSCLLAVDKAIELAEFTVFPNPASNEIMIQSSPAWRSLSGGSRAESREVEWSSEVEYLMNISILNPTGQELISKVNHQGPIDISTLPSGLYLMQVKDVNDKQSHTFKFNKL